jgi:hypothetical protein
MQRSAPISLAVLAREFIWLWDARHGVSTQEIAQREGLSSRRVRFGISRAQAHDTSVKGDTTAFRPPLLTPLFPIPAYTPHSGCAHHGPIKQGSVICCMVCHQSGVDGHPGLQRDPATDPKPEPDPSSTAPPTTKKTARETRKQRRARVYGATKFRLDISELESDETPAPPPAG